MVFLTQLTLFDLSPKIKSKGLEERECCPSVRYNKTAPPSEWGNI